MSFQSFCCKLGLAAVLATAAAAPIAARADLPPYVKLITIAVVGPLSGPDKAAGLQLSAGVQAAVDDANALRGITDFGWAMHSFDDLHDPGVAQQQAQFTLVDPTTTFVVGHVSGQATLLALPTYHQAEIPLIVPTAPLAAITRQNYDNVFRLCPSDIEEGIQDARYAERTLGAKRVAVVYEQDDYGVDGAQGFVNFAGAAGPMKNQQFPVDVELKDLRQLTSRIASYQPDLIFASGNPSVMVKALKALRSAGVTAPMLGTQAFSSAAVLTALGSTADGMTVSSCMPPIDLMPTAQQFVRHYQSQHGQLTPFALFGYVAGQVAIAAAKEGRTSDRPTLDRLLSVGTFQTVIGPISFTRSGDPVQPFVYIYKETGGTLKYAGTASGIPNPLIAR